MNSFASKYPAFAALLQIIAVMGQGAATPGETLVQRLEGEVAVVPQLLTFIPQASLLGSEVTALKASPSDMESGAELLVSDFAFSSAKAKAIIPAAFQTAEGLVALYGAIKS